MDRLLDDRALWNRRLGELRICFNCRYYARYALARSRINDHGGCTLSGHKVNKCMAACHEFRWRHKARAPRK